MLAKILVLATIIAACGGSAEQNAPDAGPCLLPCGVDTRNGETGPVTCSCDLPIYFPGKAYCWGGPVAELCAAQGICVQCGQEAQ